MPVYCRSTERGLHGGSDPGTGASNGFVVRLRRLLRCEPRCSRDRIRPVGADTACGARAGGRSRPRVFEAAAAPPSGSGRRAICGASPVEPERAGRDHRRRYGGDIAVRHHGLPGSLPAVRMSERQRCQRQRDHDRELRQRLRERGNRWILRRHCGPAAIHPGSALLAARPFDDLERSVDDPHPVTARIMKRISGLFRFAARQRDPLCDRSGNAAIEMALLATPVFLFVFAIINAGRVMWLQNALEYFRYASGAVRQREPKPVRHGEPDQGLRRRTIGGRF